MANVVAVGEAKKHFSEIMSRVVYNGERFIIYRHGKPVAALVSAEDLERLGEQTVPFKGKGLMAAVGALADFDGLDEMVEEIYRQRELSRDRDVPSLE